MRWKYTPEFYDELEEGAYRSALAILTRLFRLHKPKSVVDVGCGRGSWLAAAEILGSTELVGLDGSWVDPDQLMSPNISFKSMDLEKPLPLDGRFDLCLCLEVAEHISAERSKSLIGSLCGLSDVVVFSAAIPRQGGVNHVNEQWQSTWIDLFNAYEYECFDSIRPYFWESDEVEWWYRQNAFLFVSKQSKLALTIAAHDAQVAIPDIIHPLNQANKLRWQRARIDELQDHVNAAGSLVECLPYVARYFAGSHPDLARSLLKWVEFPESTGVDQE